MAESISSQQELSQTADGKLYNNLSGDPVAADYIGFLVFNATNGNMDAALAARAAVMAGEFSVSTTQVAAQTKSFDDAKKITDIADNPTAMFSFAGVEAGINISSILQSKVYYWSNTTGAGKKAETTYHLREVFDDVGTEPPADYDDNWFATNSAPTADPIERTFAEHLSTYDDDHEITNLAEVYKTINLLTDANASDLDGDTLTVANFKFDGDETPPGYISLTGGVLSIDVNSREFDDLKIGQTQTIVVEYDILDGNGGVTPNTATITITGTADLYQAFGSGSVDALHIRSDSTEGGGKINDQTLAITFTSPVPADAFDFSYAGTITATGSGLTGKNEKVTVSDLNSDDWAGAMNVTSDTVPVVRDLYATALVDHEITYNVNINGDDTDSVIVKVDYSYDYWYSA